MGGYGYIRYVAIGAGRVAVAQVRALSVPVPVPVVTARLVYQQIL